MGLYLGKEKINNLSVGAFASSGIDTSDATATASDILSGKTAYVDGSKITGSITTQSFGTGLNPSFTPTQQGIKIDAQLTEAGYYPENAPITTFASNSSFGTATAADVAAGKTFTSSAGFLITGTATSSSQSEITSEYCIGEVSSDGYKITWKPVFINSITSIKIFIIDTLDIAFQNHDVFTTVSSSNITNSQCCVVNLELNIDGDMSGIFILSDGTDNNLCEALSGTILSNTIYVLVQGIVGENTIEFSPTYNFMFNPDFKYGVLLSSE